VRVIAATNIDLKKLFEYYDERIVSRITGGFDIFRCHKRSTVSEDSG
jgi:hypothetical protein